MFRNLKIRWKLGTILVLPLVALLILASFQVGATLERRSAADRFSQLTGLAADVTRLVEALQRERAATGGYLAGPRARYASAMQAGRRQTDAMVAALRSRVGRLDLRGYSPRLRGNLRQAMRRLEALPSQRRAMDSGRISASGAANFPGDLVDDSLLMVINDIGEPAAEGIEGNVGALVEIARAKEAASQSTVLLFTALLRGQFGPGDHPRFAALVGKEDAAELRFATVASPGQLAFYNWRVWGTDVTTLAEVMRQEALSSAARPPAFDADTWLAVMSRHMDLLHEVELRVVGALAAASGAAKAAAVRQAVLTIMAMLMVVLLAIGFSLLQARSMAQPLEALEGSANDVAEHYLPEVVERLQQPDATMDELTTAALAAAGGVPVQSSDEIGRVAAAFNAVHQVAIRTAAEQAATRRSIGGMFLNLARRSQSLAVRQLELLDELEREEIEPKALDSLFKVDHLATRMRRNAENLIVLSGAETPRRWSDPIPVPRVVRAALTEVEGYQRVELLRFEEVGVVGHAAADIIHLLAELIENAIAFSPPGTPVRVSGEPVGSGYVLEIDDRGLGMSDAELTEANERLRNPPAVDFAAARMLGLYVVGRLAQRYGIRVRLRRSWSGGVTALVLLPMSLVTVPPEATAWAARGHRPPRQAASQPTELGHRLGGGPHGAGTSTEG